MLFEDSDGAMRAACQKLLESAGYDVAVCGGPEDIPGLRCPLVTTGRCALAEGADVVVTSLRWNVADNRAVLEALRNRHPHTPVIVEIPIPQAKEFPDLLKGSQVVPFPATGRAMVQAVRDALASKSAVG